MNDAVLSRAQSARRAFVAVWMFLGVLGALNHTIAMGAVGRRFDLILPHLKYGHVMFNKNLRTVRVFEYEGADGVRHRLADLQIVPAPGYENARVNVDLLTQQDYLPELCLRAFRRTKTELMFYGTEYEIDEREARASRTIMLRCGAHGLAPR